MESDAGSCTRIDGVLAEVESAAPLLASAPEALACNPMVPGELPLSRRLQVNVTDAAPAMSCGPGGATMVRAAPPVTVAASAGVTASAVASPLFATVIESAKA